MKDRTKFGHKHNIVYFSHCPYVSCNETHVGETDGRINECIINSNKREKNSHLLKDAHESQHTQVWKDGFKILILWDNLKYYEF